MKPLCCLFTVTHRMTIVRFRRMSILSVDFFKTVRIILSTQSEVVNIDGCRQKAVFFHSHMFTLKLYVNKQFTFVGPFFLLSVIIIVNFSCTQTAVICTQTDLRRIIDPFDVMFCVNSINKLALSRSRSL